MVKITGTTIRMTKGDTLPITLLLEDEFGRDYIPDEGDRIRFVVKQDINDKEPLIEQEIPTNSLFLRLPPSATKELEAPETYVYDMEITYANGDVDTFINKGKLILVEEVD